MTDETREDFEDEPMGECRECGEPCPRSELDENGLCPECQIDWDEEYPEEEEEDE